MRARDIAGIVGIAQWVAYLQFRDYLTRARPHSPLGAFGIRYAGNRAQVVFIRSVDDVILWVLIAGFVSAFVALAYFHFRRAEPSD